MPRRQDRFGYGVSIPATTARVVDTAVEILGDPDYSTARALDAYVWLANRLPRVKRRTGDKVSWAALQAQFGADMKDPKKFRRDYLKAFRQALAVYPDAKTAACCAHRRLADHALRLAGGLGRGHRGRTRRGIAARGDRRAPSLAGPPPHGLGRAQERQRPRSRSAGLSSTGYGATEGRGGAEIGLWCLLCAYWKLEPAHATAHRPC